MAEFSERLNEALVMRQMSPADLAHKTGIGEGAISQYRKGGYKAAQRNLEKIASALHVPVQWLMGASDEPAPPVFPAEALPVYRIPILGNISAGLPLYADEHIEGYTYTDLNGGAEYFALRVKGNSMNAANINNGNILIVRKQEIVENGEIAVVMVGDDEATVKRFHRTGNIITLLPQSTQPEHQPQIYDCRQTRITVIGKVVRNQMDFE